MSKKLIIKWTKPPSEELAKKGITLELFKLPKLIGIFEEQDVTVNNGRFGPYLKFKDMFVSLPKGEDPLTVELNRAIALIEEKRTENAPIYTFDKLPVHKGKGRLVLF